MAKYELKIVWCRPCRDCGYHFIATKNKASKWYRLCPSCLRWEL